MAYERKTFQQNFIKFAQKILKIEPLRLGFRRRFRKQYLRGDQDNSSQVGFAELKETADDRANIGGTIIGAPIVGQQLAQYILTDNLDADCRPMISLILSR